MELGERKLYPIFKPLRDKFKPFGIPWHKLLITIFVTIVGFGLAMATGGIKHDVNTAYTKAEYSTLTSEYESVLTSITSLETQKQRQGKKTFDEMELTSAQKETVEKARAYGITAGMSKEEVDKLVPTYHKVQEPFAPDWLRFAVGAGLPLLIGCSLFIEVNRTSASRELSRILQYSKRQKFYKNHPISYVHRRDIDYFTELNK